MEGHSDKIECRQQYPDCYNSCQEAPDLTTLENKVEIMSNP